MKRVEAWRVEESSDEKCQRMLGKRRWEVGKVRNHCRLARTRARRVGSTWYQDVEDVLMKVSMNELERGGFVASFKLNGGRGSQLW